MFLLSFIASTRNATGRDDEAGAEVKGKRSQSIMNEEPASVLIDGPRPFKPSQLKVTCKLVV